MRTTLVLPTEHDREAIINYRQEFIDHNDLMNRTNGLLQAETFEAWYEKEVINASNTTTYLVVTVDEGYLIGMIQVRHQLDDTLLLKGGHIGYSVRKSERKKGYATEMLKLALEACKELGLSNVLLTCDKENIASAKTIMKNGGVLENEVLYEGSITQRYWIDLYLPKKTRSYDQDIVVSFLSVVPRKREKYRHQTGIKRARIAD